MTDAVEVLAQALSDARNNPPTGPAFSVLDEPVREHYRAKARALLPRLVAEAVEAERDGFSDAIAGICEKYGAPEGVIMAQWIDERLARAEAAEAAGRKAALRDAAGICFGMQRWYLGDEDFDSGAFGSLGEAASAILALLPTPPVADAARVREAAQVLLDADGVVMELAITAYRFNKPKDGKRIGWGPAIEAALRALTQPQEARDE